MLLLALALVGVIPGLNVGSKGTSPSGATYRVIFAEEGLPAGATWSVTLGSAAQSASTAILTFTVANGTYPFHVPSVKNYVPTPSSGNITVQGKSQGANVVFESSVSTPLGSVFSWGIPVNATGTTAEGCPASSGHYCYSLEIAGAGSGVNISNIALSLRNSAGASVPWPAVTVSLFSPTSSDSVATYSTSTGTWSLVSPYTGALTGGDTITIYTSSTGAGEGLLGDELVATGQNGFSGTVSSSAFS
jgi:hypothetical protein